MEWWPSMVVMYMVENFGCVWPWDRNDDLMGYTIGYTMGYIIRYIYIYNGIYPYIQWDVQQTNIISESLWKRASWLKMDPLHLPNTAKKWGWFTSGCGTLFARCYHHEIAWIRLLQVHSEHVSTILFWRLSLPGPLRKPTEGSFRPICFFPRGVRKMEETFSSKRQPSKGNLKCWSISGRTTGQPI